MKNEAKILIWDIETSPLTIKAWGVYEADALEVIEPMQIICFAYKWLGGKAKVLGQDDLKGYKAGVNDDKKLVEEIHRLFSEADIIVAHNGDGYDQKIAHARMMSYHMTPPEPYKQIDTKKVARKYARFASNRLNDLSRELELGQKLRHEGYQLWQGVAKGDKKSWSTMKRYCKQDVELEEKLYLELRPWIENHPSVGVIEDRPDVCPKCGGSQMQGRGFSITKTGKRRRFQCQVCGGWSMGRILTRTETAYIN